MRNEDEVRKEKKKKKLMIGHVVFRDVFYYRKEGITFAEVEVGGGLSDDRRICSRD
jgi:hypothetical protein